MIQFFFSIVPDPIHLIPCMQVMSTQYISSWSNNICSDFDLYSDKTLFCVWLTVNWTSFIFTTHWDVPHKDDKTFHEPVLKSFDRFVGRRVSDSPAVACLDFVTMLFPGAGCQPCVQPPAILEDRLDCFLVWVFITDQSGMGDPTSSYAPASIAPWLIRPHKPHHERQGHAIPRWRE